jgi:flap endonuclease-1
VKNLAITGRRKLPRKNVYVTVAPEEIHLDVTLRDLGLTREQLVDVGILVGTDFNEGVRGIGPKKALAGIRKHGRAEGVLAEVGAEIEGLDEVREIFLNPRVVPVSELAWRPADPEKVKAMLCDEFDFSPERIDQALAKFEVSRVAASQASLDRFSDTR